MIEKIRIELWDIFVYFVTGIIVIINFYLIDKTVVQKLIYLVNELNIHSVIVLIFVIIIPLVIGYLIEPFANIYGKAIYPFFWFKKIKNWGEKIEKQLPLIKKKIPDINEDDNIYHYCLNYITQKNIMSPSMAFLSKFGFYRNLSLIFFLNFLYCIYLIFTVSHYYLIAFFILLFLSQFYYYRSLQFYNHLTQTVYQNFLIATSDKDIQ